MYLIIKYNSVASQCDGYALETHYYSAFAFWKQFISNFHEKDKL